MTAQLPALVIVVPLVASILVALVGRRWRRAAWPLAVLALTVALAGAVRLLWLVQHPPAETLYLDAGRTSWLAPAADSGTGVFHYAMGGWLSPTGIEYRIDSLNALVLVMVAAVGLLALLWGPRSVDREIRRAAHASWYAVALLFVTGLLGITITGDVFNLYVFLEISSISAYVLVAMGRRRSGLYAGFTYLVLGSIGATFVLIGIGHLYMATGSLGMVDIAARLPEASAAHPSVVRTAFAFIAVGLAVKMALFPLHSWQPGAYRHAPSMASLLLAATATKVAAYAFYRLAFTVFGPAYLAEGVPMILDGMLVMAAAAMIVGPLLAVRQRNLKSMLAYSSVGQIGFVILGAVLLSEDGSFSARAMTGSLVHFWNHAAAKGALFAVAGIVAFRAGRARLEDLNGLGTRAPWTAAAMTVAALSLVGVPLTGGFVTKYYLALGSLDAGRWVLVPIILASSLLTATYTWKCMQRVWFAAPDDPVTVKSDAPWSMRLPTLALAAGCLVFGIAASVPVDIATSAIESLLR